MEIKKPELTSDKRFGRVRNLVWNLSEADYIVNGTSISADDLRFFRVKSVRENSFGSFADKMKNVISSMRDTAYNYVYVLTGTPCGVTIDIGVGKNPGNRSAKFTNAWNYGDILSNSFLGNIPGSTLEPVDAVSLKDSMKKYQRFAVVTGVPHVPDISENDAERRPGGLDCFINSCQGINWRMVITANPVSSENILAVYEALCELYNGFCFHSKNSSQEAVNIQTSNSHSDGESKSDAHTNGNSGGHSSGETITSNDKNHQDNQSGHKDWNKSDTHTEQQSKNDTETSSSTQGVTVTYEHSNKMNAELMSYMENVLFKRLRSGISSGMFRTDVVLMSDNGSDLERVQSLFCGVFGGSEEELNPLHRVDISSLPDEQQKSVAGSLLEDRIMIRSKDPNQLIFGHKQTEDMCGTSTLLTAGELAQIAGIPEKEVTGLPVKPDATFGMNSDVSGNDLILGPLIVNGNVMDGRKVGLPQKNLTRHVLVAGVTGSGKTTTCQKLLVESGLPFLVIEPAKTEYRSLIRTAFGSNLEIYTLGNERNSPFRLNPFELMPGENFTAHVDMLSASFTSAFPMEAALPQVLETSIYRCYEKYGWSVASGRNKYTDDPFTGDGRYFPILEDMKQAISEVVKEMNFGPTMQADYIGSLNGRICNLTEGSKGCMLNCRKSVDFGALLDRKVVFELEELRSGNDKSFVMGLIMSRLSECLKIRHHRDPGFRHITLVEEAHRLLSRTDGSDSMAKRAAVDSFTDLLAEVRKYGEALVIADQIPNKLAPDVLKNTNTKLIHRLFAADDKKSTGDAMMMDEKQQMYLSSLRPGEVIMFSDNVDRPVHIRIESCTDTSAEVSDQELSDLFKRMRKQNDALIADSCYFNRISAEQRYILDRYNDEMGGCVEKIIKLAPNEDSACSEMFRDMIRTTEEVLKKVSEESGLSQERVWTEYVWRAMIRNGAMMKDFSIIQSTLCEMPEFFTRFFENHMQDNGPIAGLVEKLKLII